MAPLAQSNVAATLRPGTLLGTYPERHEPVMGQVERVVTRIARWAGRGAQRAARRSHRVTRLVDAQAKDLQSASDEQLAVLVTELRGQLMRDGLAETPSARAFAVVRELAGRRLGMRHFDVQLIGGWVMLNGMLAEMETGEGKTLTATLPACTAAMAGIPVHVVTVNDYLATRDADLMRPLYEALGLTVGIVTEDTPPEERQGAYACDVTYCTNKQLVFDYLKDRLLLGGSRQPLRLQVDRLYGEQGRAGKLLLRGLCFAIVDEADSVLIDEARTPLILSRGGDGQQQDTPYRQALELGGQLRQDFDFVVREREREVELTERGRAKLEELSAGLDGVWSGPRRREHLVHQALCAVHLYVADQHYLVRDGKVQIIDEYTGRVMADRSWQSGLHQMIEVKEGCELSAQAQTLARISYQRFFRRYLRLAGMTGTAAEVSSELYSVYQLATVRVPSHRPTRRTAWSDRLYTNEAAKWRAISQRVAELHAARRAVLIGTRSVAASDHLSALLEAERLRHQVLSARQDREEAVVIGCAGECGRITVATNMAGRGTDIALSPEVCKRGGLHVIASERHEAARIDRQLFGRCARQGDPGSYEAILSLDDDLVSRYLPIAIRRLVTVLANPERPLPRWLGFALSRYAQRRAEVEHARMRSDLLRADEHLGKSLGFTGRME